jgi:hypothetical protein
MIKGAHSLLSNQPGDLHFVTITHPRWELPVGKLAEANIPAVRQWLYRRFKKLDASVIAVGGFEASLNIELDGSSTWAGHVHLVVAGSNRPSLKKAFQIERHYRVKPYLRPVDIRDVGNLGRQLGYSLKRIARRRVAYMDGQGRQNRNQANLSSSEQREFDRWLLGLLVGARTILIGCRAHGSRLRLIKGSREWRGKAQEPLFQRGSLRPKAKVEALKAVSVGPVNTAFDDTKGVKSAWKCVSVLIKVLFEGGFQAIYQQNCSWATAIIGVHSKTPIMWALAP